MANFDYNFKNSGSNRQRRGESFDRKLRLTVLFLIVAAITAIVIFAIIPKSEIEDDGKTPDNKVTPPALVDNATPTGDSGKADDPGKTVADKKIIPVDLPRTVAPVRSGAADPDAEQQLRAALNNGDFKAFFQLADKLVSATAPDSEARAKLGEILTEGRKKAWQSGKWKTCAEVYRVVSGDYPLKIAGKNQTTLEMLLKGNDLQKNSRINISQRLYLVPGPWRVIISRKAQLLTVMQKESVFAVFKFAVNDKKPLPADHFTIRKRVKSPTFIDRHGRHFKSGTDANMLGEAMLYLRRKGKGGNFGIHGISPKNKTVNNYCIQMHNEDILMLYHLLPTKTPVVVTD